MPSTPSATPVAKTPSKTYTNWEAFAKAGLSLHTLDCSAYKPVHLVDTSCHTHLMYDVPTLTRHMGADHGGAYRLYVRKTDGKALPLWDALTTSGLEAKDFRCLACWEKVRFHPTSMLPHCKPHRGITKQAYKEAISDKPGCIGVFGVTLTTEVPEIDNDSEEFAEE